MVSRVLSMCVFGSALCLVSLSGCDGVDLGDGVDPESGAAALSGDSVAASPSYDRVLDLGVRTPTLRDRATRASAFEPATAVDDVVTEPLDGTALDNLSCDQAVALPDSGVIDVPAHGDVGQGDGCFAQTYYHQRFFSVPVAPDEVVVVSSPSAMSVPLWLNAAPACDTPPEACRTEWTSVSPGVALANSTKSVADRIVSVMVNPNAPFDEDSYDLVVERERLAPHAACANPRDMGAALEGERFVGASVEPNTIPLRRALYYTTVVPPMSRARVDITGDDYLYSYLLWDCDSRDWSAQGQIANTTNEARPLIVMLGTYRGLADERFDLSLEVSELVPEAACDQPLEMSVGDSATLEIALGDDLTDGCWCMPSARKVHVAVTLPASSTVVVRGTAGEEGGAVLVELPEQCSEACGNNVSFGWGETPAELLFVNEGTEPVERQLMVSTQEVWDEDGTTRHPPVTLTVETAPSDSSQQP